MKVTTEFAFVGLVVYDAMHIVLCTLKWFRSFQQESAKASELPIKILNHSARNSN